MLKELEIFNPKYKHPKSRSQDPHRLIPLFSHVNFFLSDWLFWVLILINALIFSLSLNAGSSDDGIEKELFFFAIMTFISYIIMTIILEEMHQKIIFIKHGIISECTLHSITEVVGSYNDSENEGTSSNEYYLYIDFLTADGKLIKTQIFKRNFWNEKRYVKNQKYNIAYLPWKPTEAIFIDSLNKYYKEILMAH